MGNDYFCINKCLPQSTITLSLNCFKVPLIQKYWKTINYRNHCIFKQTWPKFQNMIIFTHFIHFSYLGTRFRNFAFNLEPTSVQILQFDQDAGSRGIYSVKVFWEVYVSLLIAFAQSKYGTNKFLDMTFEKVWKRQVS